MFHIFISQDAPFLLVAFHVGIFIFFFVFLPFFNIMFHSFHHPVFILVFQKIGELKLVNL